MSRRTRTLATLTAAAAALGLAASAQAQEKTFKIYGFGAKSGVVGIPPPQSPPPMQASSRTSSPSESPGLSLAHPAARHPFRVDAFARAGGCTAA